MSKHRKNIFIEQMTTIAAQVPGISLAAGGILSNKYAERRRRFRSPLQPAGSVFMIAWTVQAVLLGFVGQGISESGDESLKTWWQVWASLLGPLQAISTWLAALYQDTNPLVSLQQDILYVSVLLGILLQIVTRLQQPDSAQTYKYRAFIWVSVGWIALAEVLVLQAQNAQSPIPAFSGGLQKNLS